ncbi:hypothetical protein M9H77_18770 [Catharanthus roseus]|uniref:Uncharacterized protein n=1 Tax=Catharanthus roseus TaxID=4058 RepID=A0ACC0B8J1_CATRO|nr:hypothetical protein M9H77_18770 [Catharanthus roseus]
MSGVWVFKNNGVIRLVENPAAEQEGRNGNSSSRRKVLVHLPSGQIVSSYNFLEQILTGLGWERYYGGDSDLFQFHKRSSIDLISLPRFALRSVIMLMSLSYINVLRILTTLGEEEGGGGGDGDGGDGGQGGGGLGVV